MKNRYNLKSPYHDGYNMWFEKYQALSEILNVDTSTRIWDDTAIRSELLLRVGNDEGYYWRLGDQKTATIPFLTTELKKIESSFEIYKQKRIGQGFEKPTELPKELLTAKLQLEAKLDVAVEEASVLQRKLDELNSVEQRVDDSRVLEHGLICSGKFHGTHAETYELMTTLVILDGQKLSQMPDGSLFIDDTRSKYDGMLVSDYRKLAKQWVLDKINAYRAKLKHMQAQAKATGQPMPDVLPVTSRRRVSQESLPAFPDWAENVKLKKVPTVAETIVRSRVKVK